jgi:hypothetical protein
MNLINRFGRGRLIGATSMASVSTALWIAPAALLPGAQVSPMLVTVGVAIPFGVAALALSLMEERIKRDLRPVDRRDVELREWRDLADHYEAGVTRR